MASKLDLDKLGESTGDPREDQARAIIKEALIKMTLMANRNRDSRSRTTGSTIVSELFLMAIIELVDSGIDTMCVELKADGVLRLKINTDFVIKVGVDVTQRGLTHEMFHVMFPVFMQKRDGSIEFLADYMREELFVKGALEYWNNARVMKAFGDKTMLDVGVDGEPIGLMDPDKAYAAYRKFKKEVGQDPVSRDEFISSPDACYRYLREMPKPPKQRHTGGCNHDRGGGTGDPGEPGNPGGGVDPEMAETIMDQVFDDLMVRALKGDEAARDALLDFGEQVGGEGSKFWSDLGLGALIGKEVPPAQVRFWGQFLTNAIGSKLIPGLSMVFPKKEAGLIPHYEAIGAGVPLRPMGKETEKVVWGFVDTSGSMPPELVSRILALAGQVEGCEVKWHTFSTTVTYCPDPTRIEYRVDGTDFSCIDQWITEADEDPDCVLIVTDGEAPPISPTWSDEAVWVITRGGSMWPADAGMECIESDIPSRDV